MNSLYWGKTFSWCLRCRPKTVIKQLRIRAPFSRSSSRLFLRLSFSLSLFFTACPDDHKPPPVADCDPGYHPCGEDSTECCLDTTSHNFIWEIDTLGDYGSYLNDVAIIDENNVWVVGYIKTGDSSYNAANWNGSNWDFIRLPAVTYGGSISQGALTSIHAIDYENIWCSSDAGSYVRWNGQDWHSEWIPDRNGGINAVWSTSSSNLFFVGNNGSIVHYDGSAFTRMESGTNIILRNIFGINDHVFVVGYNDSGDLSGQSIALELKDGLWQTLFTSTHYLGDPANGDYGRFQAVHVLGDTAYFATGGTWLVKYNYTMETTTIIPKYKHFSEGYRLIDISGNSPNDLMLTSAWGDVFHYNGVDWFYDDFIYNHFGPNNFYPRAGELKNNIAVIVGILDGYSGGIVARGFRME